MNNILIELATIAIAEELQDIEIDKEKYLRKLPALAEEKATFVTLNLDGKLRGCVGSLTARRSLVEDVIANAKLAAFHDSRFAPLTSEEFKNIEITISILSSPKRLKYSSVADLKNKIRPGIDGVILKHKGKQATFLPSVWQQVKTFDAFFHHLTLKAGLSSDCLKEFPEIYLYQAEKIEKEDVFYKVMEDKVQCLLCARKCKLKDNAVGFCGANKNIDGKIENIVFGHPISINIDPTEKKPLYHFLPSSRTLSLGTIGCNFTCNFCQNSGISQTRKINNNEYVSPEQLVDMAIKNNCKSISYTYNEPTVFYPYAKATAKLARKKNIKNIFVSNGFQSEEVIKDMKGVVDAINIDLKSFNPDFYKEIGGDLEIVKRNLKAIVKNNIWLEVTTLVIPGKNDSTEELKQIASFIATELGVNIPWHISAFFPTYKLTDSPPTSIDILERAFDIGVKAGLNYVYEGNINKPNPTSCVTCHELLINRNRFTVLENNLINGKCPKCKKILEGTFFVDTRECAVMGSFYPEKDDEVNKYFVDNPEHKNSNIKAIIVPHAGYVYSGITANLVYSKTCQIYDRIIVIGPSHKVKFKGASVALYEKFQTPLGNIEIDIDYARKLINKFKFLGFAEQIHHEHSTETQMPFVKNYFPESKVVEIIYGQIECDDLAKLINDILKNTKNLLVLSSDLSHFHSLEEANNIDQKSIKAIEDINPEIFTDECEACGGVGIKALLSVAKQENLKSNIIDYRTSYDVTKDKSSVVGYMSAMII